jgi:hypothetical protein
VEGFSNVGSGEKSTFKKENKFPHKKAHHEGDWSVVGKQLKNNNLQLEGSI